MVGRVAQYSPAASRPKELRSWALPSSAAVLGDWESYAAASTVAAQGSAGLRARLRQADTTAMVTCSGLDSTASVASSSAGWEACAIALHSMQHGSI